MQVSNNVKNLSIGNSNIIKPNIHNINSDTFQRSSNVSKPEHSGINFSVGLYSPKQMLKAYCNPVFVKSLIDKNPNIEKILSQNLMVAEISPENLLDILNSHLTTTSNYAMQIANRLKLSQYDKQILNQACLFHDFGKILIPKSIVSKPSGLTPEEKRIMDLHSQLGYELLTPTPIDKKVAELIRDHHKKYDKNSTLLQDILSVADIYSALREQRSYKKPLSNKEAIAILDQKANNGDVSTEVVNALKDSIIKSYAA